PSCCCMCSRPSACGCPRCCTDLKHADKIAPLSRRLAGPRNGAGFFYAVLLTTRKFTDCSLKTTAIDGKLIYARTIKILFFTFCLLERHMRKNFHIAHAETVVRADQYLISKTDKKGNITYVNPAFI